MATIEKLQGEVTLLQEEVGCLRQGVFEWDDRLSHLEEEVESEKHLKETAREDARSNRLSAEYPKQDLEKECSASQTSAVDIKDLEDRLARLESELYKAKMDDNRR